MSDFQEENDFSERPQSQADEEMQSGKLAPRVELLFQLIVQRLGKNENCWPAQEWLAEQLGVSCRTVQRGVAMLVAARRIGVKRMSRTRRSRPRNHYYLITPVQATKMSGHDTTKMSGYNTTKMSGHDTTKMSPLSLDEFDSLEGESAKSENASPPPGAENAKCQMPNAPDHPNVEKALKNIHEFRALPFDERESIEARVRMQPPSELTLDEYYFENECVAEMLRRRSDRPFLHFKREFIRRAPLLKNGDSGAFIDDWEPSFDRLNATLEEMHETLERWLADPRRNRDKWEGKWPRSALTPLLTKIRDIRREKLPPNNAPSSPGTPSLFDPAPAASVAPKAPLAFDEFGACADVAREICAKLGEARFRLWFDEKKTRWDRAGDRLRIATPTAFMQDWLKQKFGAEIRQVATDRGLNGVDFVIGEELSEKTNGEE